MPHVAADTAGKAKNQCLSKKAKKATLKAEFDLCYEIKTCSPQKVAIIKCSYLNHQMHAVATNEWFSRNYTIGGLFLGLQWSSPLKIINLEQKHTLNGLSKGTLLLQLFVGNIFWFHNTSQIRPLKLHFWPLLKGTDFLAFLALSAATWGIWKF